MQKKCPTCHKALVEPETTYWPFCSKRCRMQDLGKWLNEEYRVPIEEKQNGQTTEDEN